MLFGDMETMISDSRTRRVESILACTVSHVDHPHYCPRHRIKEYGIDHLLHDSDATASVQVGVVGTDIPGIGRRNWPRQGKGVVYDH